MRKQKRPSCFSAILDLMGDYQPRTSEMIADLTGFSHGRVRSELAANFNFATERRAVRGGGRVTWYAMRRHNLKPVSELVMETSE